MKRLKTYISICSLIMTMTVSVQAQTDTMKDIVRKAKADLINVLSETREQFDFGINAEDVKNAQDASPVNYYEMNFERLLNYNGQSMAGILERDIKKIIPLVDNNKVVTTVGVTEDKQGTYQITDLINHQYHKELNDLPEAIKQDGFKGLKIIYIPNLIATIYHVDGKNYTAYKGNSLKESVDDTTLLQLLKNDANSFQTKYGSQLKDGRLLD
ncbi:hypothetical protein MHTCC0001_33540 [Flavobacteriaceae bacterium MHTCC 0001]